MSPQETVRQLSAADGQHNGPTSLGKAETIFELVAKEAQAGKDRYAQIPFQEYLQRFIDGLNATPPKRPPVNAAEHVYRAIVPPGRPAEQQRKAYENFFRQRDDDYAFFGNPHALGEIATFLNAQANRKMYGDTAFLILGPTGAGKSLVTDAIKAGFEEFTRTSDVVYAINECPIQENPLHLLEKGARAHLKNEYGYEVHGSLCPDCELRLQSRYQHDSRSVAIVGIPFSANLGRGIVTLTPKDTASFAENHDAVSTIILGANRGILEVAELLRHSNPFLDSLLTLIRERRINVGNRAYRLDTVIIAHATLAEWEALDKKKTQPLRERFADVTLRYPLALSDEVAIYKKLVDQSIQVPHISPQTLEMLALIAVRSRIKDTPQAKIDDKLALYDGREIAALKTTDRARIEMEGRALGEGLTGFSPPVMRDLLSGMIANAGECLNPLTALVRVDAWIRAATYASENQRSDDLKHIAKARTEYDAWLVQTVERAFRGEYEEACRKAFDLYVENVELWTTGKTQWNPVTQHDEPPDERFMRSLEEIARPPITETGKKTRSA